MATTTRFRLVPKEFILALVIFHGSESIYAQTPQLKASKYLTEAAFISGTIAEQQEQIRTASLARLNYEYREISIPRVEIGKSKRDRNLEAQANAGIASNFPKLASGVKYKTTNMQSVMFAVDWGIAGTFELSAPGSYESVLVSQPSVDVATVYSGGAAVAMPRIHWNCGENDQEFTVSKVETDEVSLRVKETIEKVTKENITINVEAQGGVLDVIKQKNTAEFKKEILRKRVSEIESFEKRTLSTTTGSKFKVPKYSSLDRGLYVRKTEKRYKVNARVEFDAELVVRVLNSPVPLRYALERVWYFPIGRWSSFVNASQRSLPIEATVIVEADELHILEAVPTTYGSEDACKKALNAAMVA